MAIPCVRALRFAWFCPHAMLASVFLCWHGFTNLRESGGFRVTEGTQHSNSEATANLDLLRSIAVLLVVGRHLAGMSGASYLGPVPLQPLGILGVLLFFVHTSLVLMHSLERQGGIPAHGTATGWARFMVRRVMRIYPLSILVILALAVAIPLIPPGVPRFGIAPDYDAAMLWSNLGLVQDLTRLPDMMGPLWGLPLEIEMYLVLPFLHVVARTARGPVILALAWCMAVGVALVFAAGLAPWMPPVFRYVPCFLPGVLAFALRGRAQRWSPAWLPVYLAVSGGAYLAGYHLLGRGQAVLGIPVCLGLGLLLPHLRDLRVDWLGRICKSIATYSYGIYLLHIPSMWLAFVLGRTLPGPVQWASFVVLLPLSSWAAYHGVEKPLIRWGIRMSERIGKPSSAEAVSRPGTFGSATRQPDQVKRTNAGTMV